MTMTDDAANVVASVIHMTNFEGLSTMVGRPTVMAKNPNTAEAITRYKAYFTRFWNSALNGPEFWSIVPASDVSCPARESWMPDSLPRSDTPSSCPDSRSASAASCCFL